MRTMLNKRLGAALLTGMACLTVAGSALGQWTDPRDMEIPELNKMKTPEPERIELSNGMVVFLLEDHEFPVVDAQALIRVGSIYEPADKVGLAGLTGQVMRTGGSTSMDGDALDEKLESLGASVETSIGQNSGFASVSTLSEDIAEGFTILNDLMRNPAFPDEKIDLAKKQARTGIASRNDELIGILQREMPKLIYGPDHPYARHTEYATIDAITRDDMIAFAGEYFHPDRVIMTVYGDFDSGEMKALLESTFGDWARSSKPLPADPEVNPSDVTGTFLANKDNTTQSAVVLGHEGLRMDDPDYAAMMVYHEVMGGGLTGRLFNEIRSTLGLAYATGSAAGAGLHHPGGQFFYAITQSDSTATTLRYLRLEVEKSLAEPFTATEMTAAKDAILNAMVFQLSSKFSVLNRMANYEYYGYPMDFLTSYQETVRDVTAEEVLAAAKRNIRYPDVMTLIVGTKENFSESLGALGAYTELDIEIPEPEGDEIPEATPASLEAGQKLLAGAAEAAGIAAFGSVTDMVLRESGTLAIQGMDLQISSVTSRTYPDGCERAEIKLPMGTIVQSFCNGEGWMDQMQGPQPMPAEDMAKFEAQQERDLMNLLDSYPDLKLQALAETAEVEGMVCDVVYVHSENVKAWKIYVDQDSKLIARMDYRDTDFMGSPVLASEVLLDYREIEGFMWAYHRKILHDGDQVIELKADGDPVLNGGIDAGLFKMPSE